MKDNFKK